MTYDQISSILRSTIERIHALILVKGREYSVGDDRLANFKRGAEMTGAHPLQVHLIYMSKHWDAWSTFVKETVSGDGPRPRSEPIEGRLDDIITYAILAKALLAETVSVPKPEPEPEPESTQVVIQQGTWVGESVRDRGWSPEVLSQLAGTRNIYPRD